MGSKNIIRITMACTLWMQGLYTSAGDFDFRAAEDSLKVLSLNIIRPADDSLRLQHNALFFDAMLEVLQEEGSIDYPFDSLTTVSVLQHDACGIRIFTWYVPLQQDRYIYFGLVQIADTTRASSIIVLSDSTQHIQNPLHEALSAERWYGAYYYELIGHETEDGWMLTLLGWKGDNPYTRKRVVEPLVIRDDALVFGQQMFRGARGNPYRIVFEYASHVSMSLLYEAHFLDQMQEQRVPMIIFDRLSPIQEQFKGQYRYYVPEGNIFDALVFEEGVWVFYRDVDARFRMPRR